MVAFSIELQRAARADLADAVAWYEQRAPGLGERLSDDVERALFRAADGPQRYPLIRQDARRIVLDTFPYALFYRVIGMRIVVFAMLHERRDPAIWRART